VNVAKLITLFQQDRCWPLPGTSIGQSIECIPKGGLTSFDPNDSCLPTGIKSRMISFQCVSTVQGTYRRYPEYRSLLTRPRGIWKQYEARKGTHKDILHGFGGTFARLDTSWQSPLRGGRMEVIIFFFIFPWFFLAACAQALSDEARIAGHHAKNFTWPVREFRPNNEGWDRLMRQRLRQVAEMPGREERYQAYAQVLSSGVVQPSFTEVSFLGCGGRFPNSYSGSCCCLF